MNNPQVVSLVYRIVEGAGNVVYDNPPPVEWRTAVFVARLENGVLTCNLRKPYASEEEARAIVEMYLRVWEAETDLRRGLRELRFRYERAEWSDLRPNRDQQPETAVRVTQIGVEVVISVQHRDTYPEPPSDFKLTPDAETAWNRYQGYYLGRETLLAMAYLCLTVAEYDQLNPPSSQPRRPSRKRQAASKRYGIHVDVLQKVGELTSTKGGPAIARKYEGTQQALSDKETAWVIAALRKLILRIGEYDLNRPFTDEVTMNDLPEL